MISKTVVSSSGDGDAEPIPLSALQHWAYCPRQCALIHLEQAFEDNVFTRFIRDERTNYRVNLLPETCETPDYLAAVTPPAPGAFGFTTYVCRTCGYTYTDDYTALPGKD